jgi:hypothetical protein
MPHPYTINMYNDCIKLKYSNNEDQAWWYRIPATQEVEIGGSQLETNLGKSY